ncbi:MAG: hypothetical protein ACREMR_12180 [Gemmatimonadales bacterium]
MVTTFSGALGEPPRMMRGLAQALALSLVAPLLLGAGCATSRNILPVRPLDTPPYYYDYGGGVLTAAAVIAHLPVRAEPSASFWVKELSRSPLLDALTAWLDSAGWTRRLDSLPRPENEGPWVYVGSVDGDDAPSLDSLERARIGAPAMIVQAHEPTKRWREDLRRITSTRGVEYVLVVQVGLSDYVIRDPTRGPAEVALGTGYAIPLRWLSIIAKQVEVLHLTGALLSADGRVVRVGAEGILAKKPNVLLSLFDVRSAVSDEDFRRLLVDYRREDLAGQPLAWQVALQHLVAQLLHGIPAPRR